jgi:hypothetical protein
MTARRRRLRWDELGRRGFPGLSEGVRIVCQHVCTILGRRDFVVIVRRWRNRLPIRRPGVWTPAGVGDDRELAEAMADVLREDDVDAEARVVSAYELMHVLREEDRERILDRLNSRTTSDIERDLALRRTAAARLASYERRSGNRRAGRDRRSGRDLSLTGGEHRSGHDRRSGRDRRRAQTA